MRKPLIERTVALPAELLKPTAPPAGELASGISYQFGWWRHFVRLDYFVDDKSVCDEIEIERTDCNYGGQRAWWTCPRCSGRRRTLYLPPGRNGFACRVCHKLV